MNEPAATKEAVLSFDEWFSEGTRRFGADVTGWMFVCPVCGFEQSVQMFRERTDLPDEKIDKVLAFSCIGRFTTDGEPREAFGESGPGPCNYAGGGLFRLNPVAIQADGGERQIFAFAEAKIRTK